MGFVYLVHDEELGCEVALKTLQSLGPEQIYDLKAEFRTLAHVTHPNLVALYELFVHDAVSFFTMEFVDGVTFVEYLRRDGAVSSESDGPVRLCDLERLGAATRQLVHGLATVHAAGRVHRDIKPSNVLVDRRGRVVVLDFGLARAWRADEGTQSTDLWMVGTPAYMAPEQMLGSATPAADWYAVGTMLYEAVAGRRPFEGVPGAMLQEKGFRAPPRLRNAAPEVPEALEALVAAMMRIDPVERPSPDQMLTALEGCVPAPTDMIVEPAAAVTPETFVDRESEMAWLSQVFADFEEGRPTLLRVEGPSGIGKSELLRRFVRDVAKDRDAAVLAGRCHPCESVAYNALDGAIDALSRWMIGASEARAAFFVPRHSDALLRLFPVLGRVTVLASDVISEERGDAQDLRRRGFGALRELLTRIADRVPLVVWLDDFQWSDVDSTQLLSALLAGPEPSRMLLILSHRSEDRSGMSFLDDLLEIARGAGLATPHLALGPLDAQAAQNLAARLCADRLPSQADLDAMAVESSGSPFFVGELARAFVGSQRFPMATVPRETALRLTDVISGRARQLSSQARKILEVVCVAGHLLGRSVALNAAGIGGSGSGAAVRTFS